MADNLLRQLQLLAPGTIVIAINEHLDQVLTVDGWLEDQDVELVVPRPIQDEMRELDLTCRVTVYYHNKTIEVYHWTVEGALSLAIETLGGES